MASASRAIDPGSIPACAGIYPAQVLPVKSGSPVASLQGAWHYRVSDCISSLGVSIV